MKSLLLALLALIVATFSLDVGYEEFEDQEVEQGHVDPNEWMRWLATSVLPVPESEIRGLEWLYNATNGNNWLWNTDNITYGIHGHFLQICLWLILVTITGRVSCVHATLPIVCLTIIIGMFVGRILLQIRACYGLPW